MSGYIISLLIQYKYAIIVPIATTEGQILSVICGFLIRLGYLTFIPAYLCLMAGNLLGDIGWYYVGYFWGKPFIGRFGTYVSITEDKVAVVEKLFHKYHARILIISKLTNGFGFALVTLMTAGMIKIPFRKYITLNFFGQIFWTGGLIALGFVFGHAYESVTSLFGKISVVAGFILIVLLFWGYGNYMRNKMIKNGAV
ncbi:MAG TPA: DedA family protein [Candidatus Paceibacterota bacterium]|nr:DedA family protein [Candidatus Paceibacterota bacterium]